MNDPIPPADKDDADLVREVLAGEDSAFEELVRRYQKMAVSIAYGMTGDYTHSQDLAQNAFLSAYKSIHTIKDYSKFKNWFYGVVRRTCIYWIRKQKNEYSIEGIDGDGVIFESSEARSPLAELTQEEEKKMIQQAVQELPEKYREVILLFHFHSKSYEEIGDVLGLSYAGVDSRLLRARNMLKEKLKDF